MDQDFEKRLNDFFEQLGQSLKMVLATSLDTIVSARMMSIIIKNGRFYFQTDRAFRKYRQITGNGNVALCADNVQIEGVCKEVGRPMDDPDFYRKFEAAFPSSFAAYAKLGNERLFEVIPRFIERWLYEGGTPYIEQFDIQSGVYQKTKYTGK